MISRVKSVVLPRQNIMVLCSILSTQYFWCSPHIHMGFLWVLRFPYSSHKHIWKFPVVLNMCVCKVTFDGLVSHPLCIADSFLVFLQIHCHPDQDKELTDLTEDEWMNFNDVQLFKIVISRYTIILIYPLTNRWLFLYNKPEARQLLCTYMQFQPVSVKISRQNYTLSSFTALCLPFSSSMTQKKQKSEVLIRRIFRVCLKSEIVSCLTFLLSMWKGWLALELWQWSHQDFTEVYCRTHQHFSLRD